MATTLRNRPLTGALGALLVLGTLAGLDAPRAGATGHDWIEQAADRDGIGQAGGPVAVARLDDTVWLADTDSELLVTWDVSPETIQVAQPEPGLAVVVGPGEIETIDMASGDSEILSVDDAERLQPLADGQRLGVVSAFDEGGDQPGPERLIGLVDVVTGEEVDMDRWFEAPVVVASHPLALLVTDGDRPGLVVIDLAAPFAEPLELPTADDDGDGVAFADRGTMVAAVGDDGTLVEGPSGGPLTTVADDVDELVGAIAGGWLVRTTILEFVDGDGRRHELDLVPPDAVVGDEAGLLVAETDDTREWARLTPDGDVVALDELDDAELIASGTDHWWFGPGEQLAPFEASPVRTVAVDTGAVTDVAGKLRELAALTEDDARRSPDGRFLIAVAFTTDGFDRQVLADAGAGTTLELGSPPPSLAFSPDSTHIASTTVQGPTITSIGADESSIVVTPVFDIELPADAEPDAIAYRWLETD